METSGDTKTAGVATKETETTGEEPETGGCVSGPRSVLPTTGTALRTLKGK